MDEKGNRLIEGLTTVTFAGHGDKTKLTLSRSAVAMVARAATMLEGMKTGWTQSPDRLAEILTRV